MKSHSQQVTTPGGGNGNPLQYSCLENPMDSGSQWATPWGHKESDMTNQLSSEQQLKKGHHLLSIYTNNRLNIERALPQLPLIMRLPLIIIINVIICIHSVSPMMTSMRGLEKCETRQSLRHTKRLWGQNGVKIEKCSLGELISGHFIRSKFMILLHHC